MDGTKYNENAEISRARRNCDSSLRSHTPRVNMYNMDDADYKTQDPKSVTLRYSLESREQNGKSDGGRQPLTHNLSQATRALVHWQAREPAESYLGLDCITKSHQYYTMADPPPEAGPSTPRTNTTTTNANTTPSRPPILIPITIPSFDEALEKLRALPPLQIPPSTTTTLPSASTFSERHSDRHSSSHHSERHSDRHSHRSHSHRHHHHSHPHRCSKHKRKETPEERHARHALRASETPSQRAERHALRLLKELKRLTAENTYLRFVAELRRLRERPERFELVRRGEGLRWVGGLGIEIAGTGKYEEEGMDWEGEGEREVEGEGEVEPKFPVSPIVEEPVFPVSPVEFPSSPVEGWCIEDGVYEDGTGGWEVQWIVEGRVRCMRMWTVDGGHWTRAVDGTGGEFTFAESPGEFTFSNSPGEFTFAPGDDGQGGQWVRRGGGGTPSGSGMGSGSGSGSETSGFS
ncbi:hypothetical protein BC629DRAFT_1727117 [Irpex lacteus]|nr:hypothetical protein BC629DRAFT_1727117 [Irpex lacteus]